MTPTPPAGNPRVDGGVRPARKVAGRRRESADGSVFDARIAAVCREAGVRALLTEIATSPGSPGSRPSGFRAEIRLDGCQPAPPALQ